MEIYNKYIINNKDGASQFFWDYGIPERSLIEWCKTLVNNFTNFIDIGSHIGTYSISLAKYVNKVYAFEASKLTYNQLCGSIALHDIHNIETFNVALSNENTNKFLWHVSIDGGGNSLIKPPDNLIKMDIEGNELNCLKGATETIKHSRPKILFESNKDDNNRKELFDFLESLDYNISTITMYPNMFIGYPK